MCSAPTPKADAPLNEIPTECSVCIINNDKQSLPNDSLKTSTNENPLVTWFVKALSNFTRFFPVLRTMEAHLIKLCPECCTMLQAVLPILGYIVSSQGLLSKCF